MMSTSPAKVIGLAALPRSGTTLLTSVLGVHSRVLAIYEPWNATKEKGTIRDRVGLADFLAQANPEFAGKDVLLVKETTTYPRYLQNLEFLVRSAGESCSSDLIILMRTPLHVFTSEIEARREWWGSTGLQASREEFGRWAEKTMRSLRLLEQVAVESNALLVSYEATVVRPGLVASIMEELGLALEPAQLEYEKHLDRRIVRGDVGLASRPLPISDESIARRRREIEGLEETIHDHPLFAAMQRQTEVTDRLVRKGIARRSEFGSLIP